MGSYKQLLQAQMPDVVLYLANFEVTKPTRAKTELPKASPEPKKLEAAPLGNMDIDAASYEQGRRVFEHFEDLKMRVDSLRLFIQFIARPGARSLGISEEKKVLYENMQDCINAAVTGMNMVFYNLRGARRVGSQTDFLE